MNIKRFFLILMFTLIMAIFPPIEVYASENPTIMQAYINDKTIDLFLFGEFDEDRITVKVANQEASVFNSGTISDEEISVCTTILVDISTSMPPTTRSNVNEFIGYKIKNIEKNEQLRIITFGAEIKILQDFTSDRYDLDKAAESIKFDETQSALYDAIYNTLPDIQLLNDKPCFYRTIVVTDGADYAVQGVTKEELFMRLMAETYPLDILCVSDEKPNAQNKDLSALARISNGRYFDVYPELDIFQLVSDISVSDYFWIRAEVPVSLLDGSTRQVDVSDGNKSLSFDMKLSVVDAPTENNSSIQASSSFVIESSQQTESSVLSTPSLSTSSAENIEDGVEINPTIFIVIVAVGAVVAICVIVVVILVSKKKSLTSTQNHQVNASPTQNSSSLDRTEFIGEDENGKRYAIKISNTANPNESWILDVSADIIIGRADGCIVKIDEKSVAHQQCKISASAKGLIIIELSKSNPTKLNGTSVSGEMMLHPADTIHFGRITLRVDYIQKIGEEPPTLQTPNGNTSGGNTQSIF